MKIVGTVVSVLPKTPPVNNQFDLRLMLATDTGLRDLATVTLNTSLLSSLQMTSIKGELVDFYSAMGEQIQTTDIFIYGGPIV